MGNPVGRTITAFCNLNDNTNAYVFGLWCADGYHRTSSIGLTSVDIKLITNFAKFFKSFFPEERIKLRIYSSDGSTGYRLSKAKQLAYCIYVNSRPLLRFFKTAREDQCKYLKKNFLPAYFAGRFDGDGSVAKNNISDLRIAYGYKDEAGRDAKLLRKINFSPKIYYYKNAKTYVIYISRYESKHFLNLIKPFRLRYRKQ